MPMQFDPRRTPARSDLAANHLRGLVEAGRFVEGIRQQVMASHTSLRRSPSFEAGLETEALRGEYVTIYETGDEGWSWGQLERDNYVGWLPSCDLGLTGLPPTHKIKVQRSFTYPGPSMKLPISGMLSMGSQLNIIEMNGDFARTDKGEFIWTTHLSTISSDESDFVAVAEQFLHVPYLWGGKTSLGLDCSALLQNSLQAAGIKAPRDSDMLAAEIGEPIEINKDFSNLKRGDLIFWKGHCGLLQDPTTLLHSNGYHMAVASENLIGAVNRIRSNSYGDVTGIRRLK
jgi:cell wall-associated NlpC family hydrolase